MISGAMVNFRIFAKLFPPSPLRPHGHAHISSNLWLHSTPVYHFPSLVEPKSQLSKKLLSRSHDKSRSEEHTSEIQSLMRLPYAVFGLKKNKHKHHIPT